MKSAGTTTYLVNGLGQRVRKNAGSDLYFVYDEAGRLIGEYDSTGAPVQETVWLGDIPVAVMKPATSSFTLYYVWADHLGTPRMITDTSNAARWEWAHNDPFGNNLPDENPASLGAFAFNLRFPGQYYDTETGLSYNMARDYDARIGRYLQSDPIGLRGGLNSYAYVSGNPLAFVDALGLQAGAGVGGAGGAAGAAGAAAIGQGIGNAVNTCFPEDPCEHLRRRIEGHLDAMERAYLDMFNDPNDLYRRAFDTKIPGHERMGTWLGHGQRYDGYRQHLNDLIGEANRLGCPIPIRAFTWLLRSAPIKPFFK